MFMSDIRLLHSFRHGASESSRMISVESQRCQELYDGCYVVFMTFVIRSHDRHCNYDVLCRPGSAGNHGKTLAPALNSPQQLFRTLFMTWHKVMIQRHARIILQQCRSMTSYFSSIYSELRFDMHFLVRISSGLVSRRCS